VFLFTWTKQLHQEKISSVKCLVEISADKVLPKSVHPETGGGGGNGD